jgi:hypothetical protein
MSEDEFWELLRFRIMSGVRGSPVDLPGYWDWFEPKKYVLDGSSPHVVGRVGFVSGRDGWSRPFVLFLRNAVGALSDINWATLLPPDDTTGWLLIDEARIEINPAAAFTPPVRSPDDPAE